MVFEEKERNGTPLQSVFYRSDDSLKKQKKGKAQAEIIVLNIICPETLTVLQVKYKKKFDKKNKKILIILDCK